MMKMVLSTEVMQTGGGKGVKWQWLYKEYYSDKDSDKDNDELQPQRHDNEDGSDADKDRRWRGYTATPDSLRDPNFFLCPRAKSFAIPLA